MINLILLCLALALLVYYYHVHWSRIAKNVNAIPGPRIFPFLGNALVFLGSSEEHWKRARYLNNTFYPIWRYWNFTSPLVNLRHPDDVEVLLSSTKHIEKSIFYDFLHPWFGTGLLTSTGKKWQMRRKILTPAFHFNVLQQFVDILIEEGGRMVDHLKSDGKPVVEDLVPLISEYTLHAICETAMGTSVRDRGSFQYRYRKAVYDMGKLILFRVVRPWFYSDLLFSLTPESREQNKALKILHDFTNKIIGERKDYHDQTNEKYLKNLDNEAEMNGDAAQSNVAFGLRRKRLAMLDLLIAASRNGNQIDDLGIREEVDTFMFEGHDTTAMGMCFLVLYLAQYKDIQEKARAEIDAALEENNGKMDMSTLQKFSYLERCIKESLRLYPSVPFIARKISEDLKLKKYTIPAGSSVHVHIYDIHRDPNFWTNPDEFDPDRFLPEKIQGRHPYSYIPFSAGPRNCIGQRFAMLELKAMTAHLLHNFYLEPVDKMGDIRMLTDLVLRVADPIRVRFVPISR